MTPQTNLFIYHVLKLEIYQLIKNSKSSGSKFIGGELLNIYHILHA